MIGFLLQSDNIKKSPFRLTMARFEPINTLQLITLDAVLIENSQKTEIVLFSVIQSLRKIIRLLVFTYRQGTA